jgi:hypothetical protein
MLHAKIRPGFLGKSLFTAQFFKYEDRGQNGEEDDGIFMGLAKPNRL